MKTIDTDGLTSRDIAEKVPAGRDRREELQPVLFDFGGSAVEIMDDGATFAAVRLRIDSKYFSASELLKLSKSLKKLAKRTGAREAAARA
ncbi:hypothetical protein [Cupriavidus nantongensis]|uniref:Uncharacterized protein n=1 Tax=Cupriavidus nantongensis TaxID=1796606 RepID=A0A142JMW1_9BURK|nr:hypothetical protein [Cupriavidus nantongensis]AMR79423.1 hypothetical protein A2G96_17695 [Cupriavidus nantongensis]